DEIGRTNRGRPDGGRRSSVRPAPRDLLHPFCARCARPTHQAGKAEANCTCGPDIPGRLSSYLLRLIAAARLYSLPDDKMFLRRFKTCVTRARLTPRCLARAARLSNLPLSRIA